jgi:hypothetical protein
MDTEKILADLKELTLDFVAEKRSRGETVRELHSRINPDEVYDMDENDPNRDFITEVYVSLDNLVTEDFAPSRAEIQYFADCFEGKKTFSREEVRKFAVGPYAREKTGRKD